YDVLRRLVDAWTASGAWPDAGTRQPATAGGATGPGSQRQAFGHKASAPATRNRPSTVEHSTGGPADVSTTYQNGCTTGCNRTGAQPHTLTATTGGADPTQPVYDVAGNLLTRTATSGNGQTLKWDDEGHLAEVTTTGSNPTS